ncbi:MAG: hypothetical protein HY043_15875 [Verrucomicrobia bacterium]|nr:hypothetical protein [Verrucomicrobiota bacterium]
MTPTDSSRSSATPIIAAGMHQKIIRITGLTNREFLERHAQPGRIGLSGGGAPIDKLIRRAERHVNESKEWSRWSHAFLFGEQRSDEHHWIIESDLHLARKHVRLGVQENRLAKYFDEAAYSSLAVLDFGLSARDVRAVLREGLELLANRTRYSLRELFGTLIALRRPELRGRDNLLAREHSFYCSALVQYCFRRAGIDLVPGLDVKNTTPEDLARTSAPHVMYLLERPDEPSRLRKLARRVKRRVQAQLRKPQ